MKLPHVLCQVLVESGLEHGALIWRQIKCNRNIRAAGWVRLRAETKPPSLARPSPGPEVPELGCEARGCSSTKPLLPPGSWATRAAWTAERHRQVVPNPVQRLQPEHRSHA